MKKELSIIVPVYNDEEFIEKCLMSVIDQKNNNIELIIVDSLSTDNTGKIIKRLLPHIDKYIREKDTGLYHGLNKGILEATGNYILFLPADDYLEKDSLIHVLEYLKINPITDLLYGKMKRVDVNTKQIDTTYVGDFKFNRKIYFKKNPTIPTQATFIKRKVFAKVGLYDASLTFGADTDMVMKIAKNNFDIRNIDIHISNWRICDDTLTYNPEYRWKRFFEAVRVHYRYDKNLLGPYYRNLFYTYLFYYHVREIRFFRFLYKIWKK